MVASTYVRDIDASRAFYELLGFSMPRQDGTPCGQPAEVKLADSAGHAAWACLDHAHEILLSVSGAFIASQDDGGIAAFQARRARLAISA